ncbi:MAG: amino acid adenylation domain-containing protein [Bacteroidota bacterium]
MIYLLPHTVDHVAERSPEKVAFRFGNSQITYGDLSLRSNQLAQLLIELGVQRGDRVGVYLNRSIETATAIYGIMKAGAAYVPLDPFAPAGRTQFLLKDCGIQHLISKPDQRKTLRQVIPGTGLQSLIGLKVDSAEVDATWPAQQFTWQEVAEHPSTTLPDLRILERDLAYIMYTSGSTGAPKGIMHTHYSGLSYARLSASLYGVKPEDRIANHAPLHFDISTFGYFSSPLSGATTIIIPEAYTKMPASLSQLAEKEKISIWYSVPLALVQMLQKGVLDQRDLSALRWVLYGGEPFPVKHLRTLMHLLPQTKFSNVYGPAEVNQCTFYHLPAPPEDDQPIPLGQAWNNTEIIVVDADDQPAPTGEMGELLVRTATMMDGYWNQAALTEKKLYKQVSDGGFERTFYRTGDLVRRTEDGLLHFMGRKDRQIKTRGYRVELDEVEAGLLSHPEVQEVAVFPVKDEAFGQLIEAAILLKNDIEIEELQKHLATLVPWYAIPQKIRIATSLPRTSNGKVNYLELQRLSVQTI